MPKELKLSDLFPKFISNWPSDKVRKPGTIYLDENKWLPQWLTNLNDAIKVSAVRTAASQERVALEASLSFEPIQSGYSDGFPFELPALPQIQFRLLQVKEKSPVQMYISQSDTGVEVLLEGLPLEIQVSWKIVAPHPDDEKKAQLPGGLTVGTWDTEQLDSQQIIFRTGSTSIFTHVRLRVTEDLGVVITPVVPISFGKCRFMGIPCLAVHDFQLIPSPELAFEKNLDWVRHDITAWDASHTVISEGCFAARSLYLDPAQNPTKKVARLFSGRTKNKSSDSAMELPQFVLDDLVVPYLKFTEGLMLPLPRHATLGIRRNIDSEKIEELFSPEEFYSLQKAPIRISLSEDPSYGLIIEKLFIISQLNLQHWEETKDPGFYTSVLFYFGEKKEHAFSLEWDENLTPVIYYRRSPEGQDWTNYIFNWKIADMEVAILGIRVGYSFGLACGTERRSHVDCLEALVDLFVRMPATAPKSMEFRLQTLSGQPVAFAITGIGWRFGTFHAEGLQLPDGVKALIGEVTFIIEELGMLAESGGTYISFSGGLAIRPPSGFEGGVSVKRLRIRYAGSETAPRFKLDGFFARFTAPSFELDAGGYYRDQKLNGTQLHEFGFAGTIKWTPPMLKQHLSVDLIIGNATGDKNYPYFMFQAVFEGNIPISGVVNICMLQGLFAWNMLPDVGEFAKESYEFRYLNWYFKENSPLTVPTSRRLDAWKPQDNAYAFGAGFGITYTGCGRFFTIAALGMYAKGESESTLLIVIALHLLNSSEAAALGVLELDWANGRYMVMLGVVLTLSKVLKGFPDCLDDAFIMTGTIVCGNKPATVAIGRLTDPRTWLGILVDVDLKIFRSYLQVAFCFEWVEGGNMGTAFVLRLEGSCTPSAALIRISFNAGLSTLSGSFATGSNDYALEASIECGIRAILFWSIRLGLNTRADLRQVGNTPYREELSLTLTFEMPWFMPDVTVKLETARGRVAPEEMKMFVSPLEGGTANAELTQRQNRLHIERYDKSWPEDLPQLPPGQPLGKALEKSQTRTTYSIRDLDGMHLSESARLQNFQANTEVKPIPTDSYIAVEFSMLVNDLIGIGNNTSFQGDQESGNLEKPQYNLRIGYSLIGLRIRRRPRFASGTPWTIVEDNTEETSNLSQPPGKSGKADPQVFTKNWHDDFTVGKETAKKRLLINCSTPFANVAENPEVDEETVRNNPNWPCCKGKRDFAIHRVIFRHETAGTRITDPRIFTQSASTLRIVPLAIVRPHQLQGQAVPVDALVAALDLRSPGIIFRAELDEPAAVCTIRLAWRSRTSADLKLIAYDIQGKEAGKTTVPLAHYSGFQDIILTGKEPFRRFEARIVSQQVWSTFLPGSDMAYYPLIEIDEVTYVDLADYEEFQRQRKNCDPNRKDFQIQFTGKGKLFFLPNHEYEIEIATRLDANHVSTEKAGVVAKEYLYFKTKGLPGLNAQTRVGEEMEPYVKTAYTGGQGLVYREEPVTLALREDYLVTVPLKWRPFGGSEESDQIFGLVLTVSPDTAAQLDTPFTATDGDWIVDNRKSYMAVVSSPWKPVLGQFDLKVPNTISDSPFLARLATLTQRTSTQCPLSDPRRVVSPVLVALPQGTKDPNNPSRELWPTSTRCTAVVRPEKSGFVERAVFEMTDLSAFTFSCDSGGSCAQFWSVEKGELRLKNGRSRHYVIFGEKTWDHLVVHVEARPETGSVGIAFALHTHDDLHSGEFMIPAKADTPERGLFVMLEPVGNGHRLAIYRRTALEQFVLEKEAPLTGEKQEIYTLIAHAFDDKLRLTVGEVSIETSREELRQGRLALVAEQSVNFLSLRVKGLPMYSFPFRVSRYTSFAEHIQSFGGTVFTISADDMGQNATQKTVDNLWTETSPQIDKVMNPTAVSEDREQLFSKWLTSLGLPVKTEISALEITQFKKAGLTHCLFLDSPEPLDFTQEVKLELHERVFVSNQISALSADKVESWVGKILSMNKIFGRFEELEVRSEDLLPAPPPFASPNWQAVEAEHHLLGQLARPSEFEGADGRMDIVSSPLPITLETIWDQTRIADGIVDLQRTVSGIRIDLDPAILTPGNTSFGDGRELVVIEVEEQESNNVSQATVYQGQLDFSPGGRPFVNAEETGTVLLRQGSEGKDPSVVSEMKPGTVIVTDLVTGQAIAVISKYVWKKVDMRILQNASLTRALILPLSESKPTQLSPSIYRFILSMKRKRWETEDKESKWNCYKGEVTLTLTL